MNHVQHAFVLQMQLKLKITWAHHVLRSRHPTPRCRGQPGFKAEHQAPDCCVHTGARTRCKATVLVPERDV